MRAPPRRADILDRLQALGVDSMRVQVQWRFMAPGPGSSRKPPGFDGADPGDYPAHAFEVLDSIVRGAKARGIEPLLTPTGPIPDWASSSGRGSLFDPDPDDFEDFVYALGTRYDGTCVPPECAAAPGGEPLPRVDQWAVYNEPNLKTFLRPQRDGDGTTVSGRIYRALFFAAQRGLEDSGHEDDLLLIGETAPSRGSNSTTPLKFLRQVFCLSRKYQPVRDCQPIEADGWSHHPYNPHIPPWQAPKEEHSSIISIGSMDRLVDALRRAADAGATVERLPGLRDRVRDRELSPGWVRGQPPEAGRVPGHRRVPALSQPLDQRLCPVSARRRSRSRQAALLPDRAAVRQRLPEALL